MRRTSEGGNVAHYAILFLAGHSNIFMKRPGKGSIFKQFATARLPIYISIDDVKSCLLLAYKELIVNLSFVF
jgi:hypothetical protein